MQTIEHWVGGQTFAGSSNRHSSVFNPATGAEIARVSLAEPAVVDVAVATARDAFTSWSEVSLSGRTKVLFKFREIVHSRVHELASIVSREHGKILSDAQGEVERGLDVVEFACGVPSLLKGEYSDQVSSNVDLFSFRQPLGVIAGISPFNFPVMVPMWMHPIAIATGNCFILKPSERVPSAAMMVAEMWSEAGLPDGVFNVVHGDKGSVDALLANSDVDAVSFVGSTPVAQYIHTEATAQGKRVQALGGAKNHAIVLPDADPDFASNQLASAAFGSAGERCMSISAAVAVGSSADRLVECLIDRAKSIRVGPGDDPTSEMGPVISSEAQNRIEDYIASSSLQGALVAADGRGIEVPGHEDGFFVGPTVVDRVATTMDVYVNEVFGPVLSVIRVDTVDEAIGVLNANQYGNGAAVFTESGSAARRFMREVEVGMVGINVPIPVPMAYYSFGGWKNSNFSELNIHGPEGVEFYTRGKVVTARWARNDDAPWMTSFDMPTAN